MRSTSRHNGSPAAQDIVIPHDREYAFQQLLRQAREALGPESTQEEVAEQAGVSQSFISALEHGPQPGLRFFDLAKVLKFYHIQMQDVMKVLGLEAELDHEQHGRHLRVDALVRALENFDAKDFDYLERTLNDLMRGMRSREQSE